MKTLEEEALEYIENNVFCNGITAFELEIADKAFLAGTNSKWVQAEKIKAQTECLNRAKDLDITTVYFELKQKLKDLENV